MKTEVLQQIKKSEDEYQSLVNTARDERKTRIAQAELEADNLIAKASSDAEAYKKTRLADARQQAAKSFLRGKSRQKPSLKKAKRTLTEL
jgi:V/A-type H+-transporting ATPase subunit G/H